jgi:hypothetical protein
MRLHEVVSGRTRKVVFESLALVGLLFGTATVPAQTIATADGKTPAYTIIQNALGAAPETPDCSHPGFGPHITQTTDSTLGIPVFVFNMHVTPDNDRCVNFDRQRLEIKADTTSPKDLQGLAGDTMTYQWLFRLPSGFQASSHFTHIHQIKGGEEPAASGAPIITLSVYSGGDPNEVRLIYQNGTTLTSTGAKPFEGVWVVAKEVIKVGTHGKYSMIIKTLNGGKTLLSYSNNDLNVFPSGAGFIRPKWGIYRSLLEQSALRDEQMHFNDFCIAKAPATCPKPIAANADPGISGAPRSQTITAGNSTTYTVDFADFDGARGPMKLAASGLPAGATATFSPASITAPGTSLLTINTVAGTPSGTSDIAITASNGSAERAQTVRLMVTGGARDFRLAATPAMVPAMAGSSATWRVDVGAANDFKSTVTLSASGLPAGATATFSPASITGSGSSFLTVNTAPGTRAGVSDISIMATSAELQHTVQVRLMSPSSAPDADFTLMAGSGASSVDPGNSYPYAVWVSPLNGFTGVVSFEVSGLPAGASGTFRTADSNNPLDASVPTTINGGPAEATLTVSTSASTPPGAYPLVITATSGGITHTETTTLTVNPPLRTFPVSCAGSNDTAAVNKAIASASAAGGGIVEIPAHATCATTSIHLMSHVRLQLDAGSEIRARSGIDAPESLGCTAHQDFGHSHFHDALIWGENITDIGFQGSGTITGNGVLVTGTPGSGQGDKILSLRNASEITITGITFTDGGHFAILANGTSHLSVSNIRILDSHNRDAFNLINSSNVVIDDSDIEGSDDAMVMKGDSALCAKGNNDSTFVSNSLILSTQNNATQFGSETCSNFTHFWWGNLNLTASGKAGIGITSNDGAIIDTVTYDNIHITDAAVPIFMKVDHQARCPGSPPPGLIRNIRISNVNATVSEKGFTGEFTNTINGFDSAANHVSNVTITNTQYLAPGGGSASQASTNPPENNDWAPKSLGTRPSYGWFVRHADNISFINDSVNFSSHDARPSFIANDGSNITLDGLVFGVGSGSPYDLGFIDIKGFHVGTDTVSTSGAAPRVHETGSTPN